MLLLGKTVIENGGRGREASGQSGNTRAWVSSRQTNRHITEGGKKVQGKRERGKREGRGRAREMVKKKEKKQGKWILLKQQFKGNQNDNHFSATETVYSAR